MLLWAALDCGDNMSAPTRIGRYEIVRRLGRSMTDVYLAIDTVENRKAALKLIQPGGDAVNQLVLEAERRGAAIQKELQALDPRMVEIYEYGDQDGYFFVAMQFVEGRNLAEVLDSRERHRPDSRRRHRARNLRATGQVSFLARPPWCTAISSRRISTWGRTTRCGCWISASPRRCARNGDATVHHFGSPGYCSPERLEPLGGGPAVGPVGGGRHALRDAGGRAAVPGGGYAQAGRPDPFRSGRRGRLPASVPRGPARRRAPRPGARPAQALPLGRAIPGGPAGISGTSPDRGRGRTARSRGANATIEAAREALRKATRYDAAGQAKTARRRRGGVVRRGDGVVDRRQPRLAGVAHQRRRQARAGQACAPARPAHPRVVRSGGGPRLRSLRRERRTHRSMPSTGRRPRSAWCAP